MKRTTQAFVLAAAVASAIMLAPARGESPATAPSAEERLARVDFRDLPLSDALRTLASVSHGNVVASSEASKLRVSLLLRDVTLQTAIDELCKSNDLWSQKDPQSGVTRILTSQEFQRQIGDFREQKTEVFTLLYPNAIDVAVAIRDLYGNRVQMSLGAPQELDTRDIEERFNRFNILDQRSQIQGLQGTNGTNSSGINGTNGNYGTSSSSSLRTDSLSNSGLSNPSNYTPRINTDTYGKTQTDLANLRAIQDAATPEDRAAAIANYLAAKNAAGNHNPDIFVTVAQRNNLVILRTSDPALMTQINKLIQQLDVPTPMVLLEVKVLSIDLSDGFNSAFDFQFTDRMNIAGGFSSGNIQAPISDAFPPSNQVPINVGGTGIKSNALTFQFVGSNFRARMQLLEDQNRVTSLAAPLLLTANNEVSRLFVGENRPIVTGFSPGFVTPTTGNPVITSPTPQIQIQPVGTTLLLTPNINSDRTVTLRLLQETSTVNVGGANIPVPSTNGSLTNLPVDVVQSRSVSGTVVAKDGLMIAMGGLIEEQVNDTRQEVPILGRIPIIGILFRNQTTNRTRRELVVTIRPFVLSTPADSHQISQELLDELSIHPKAPNTTGTLNTFRPDEVLHANPPKNELEKIFQFHSVAPADY